MGYRVLDPLRHDGRDYLPGDRIESINRKQAAKLVFLGVIEVEVQSPERKKPAIKGREKGPG